MPRTNQMHTCGKARIGAWADRRTSARPRPRKTPPTIAEGRDSARQAGRPPKGREGQRSPEARPASRLVLAGGPTTGEPGQRRAAGTLPSAAIIAAQKKQQDKAERHDVVGEPAFHDVPPSRISYGCSRSDRLQRWIAIGSMSAGSSLYSS